MAREASPETPDRMLPALTEHNRAFWTGGGDGRLHIAWCTRCERWVQPPAADCPACGGVLVARPVSGRGTVFTYTVNHQSFNPAVPVPYVIAIVALDEQDDLRIATNIVDCEPDSVYIGLPVEVRFERQKVDGESIFVPLFTPR
ncbi:DNA-binding protein [Mycobacteriaceae bacterium 1482268.1]|nr:DNA-binding protein [Mycobacteriaceae bacterium 1482268.1]